MQLRVINAGSGEKVKPSSCCSDPWTYEDWFQEEDDASLQRAVTQQPREPSAEGVSASV